MALVSSTSCLCRNPLSWLVVLGSFLAFSYTSYFGLLTIFITSSAVILYPVIITCYKSSHEQETAKNEDSPNPQDEDSAICEDSEEEEAIKSEKKLEREVILSSSETLSDGDSFDHTAWSEDYDNDYCVFGENLCHSTQFSDGSISDEDSLIEITLPEGHYVESSKKQEEIKQRSCCGFERKFSDCSKEQKSHFKHTNWMEMLMEEENLIEIDICMGCIKYSRLEIEA